MGSRIGILLLNEQDFSCVRKQERKRELLFFSFHKRIELSDNKVKDCIFIKINKQHQEMINNSFFVRLTFFVAYAEAYNCKSVILTDKIEDLKKVTFNVHSYIKAVKKLIKQGTKNSIEAIFLNVNDEIEDITDKQPNNQFDYDKCEILFSGGIDCTVASYIMGKMKKELLLINFWYGQSNIDEERYCCNHIKEKLRKKLKGKLVEEDLREYYKEINFSSGLLIKDLILSESNKEMEYVPFRNTIFFAICIYKALYNNIGLIVSGSQGDDTISPDNCSPYYEILQQVVDLQRQTNGIQIYPILNEIGGKPEVIQLGKKMGVNYMYCWTCHSNAKWIGGIPFQCGVCSDCSTRYSAFIKNGMVDPLPYVCKPQVRDNWVGPKVNMERILKKIGIRLD